MSMSVSVALASPSKITDAEEQQTARCSMEGREGLSLWFRWRMERRGGAGIGRWRTCTRTPVNAAQSATTPSFNVHSSYALTLSFLMSGPLRTSGQTPRSLLTLLPRRPQPWRPRPIRFRLSYLDLTPHPPSSFQRVERGLEAFDKQEACSSALTKGFSG
ncbi:hypothetical protein B0H12DRAFT_1165142 [Mycena haematopus]|nr:hypothetical protein B0H12DRAFT_1165142 [Mycena haematopus]